MEAGAHFRSMPVRRASAVVMDLGLSLQCIVIWLLEVQRWFDVFKFARSSDVCHCWVTGLQRCGKSCRLRWTNYLCPDIKRGRFSQEEDRMIVHLHAILGNR